MGTYTWATSFLADDWSSPNDWLTVPIDGSTGTVPGAGDDAYIVAGVTVSVTDSRAIATLGLAFNAAFPGSPTVDVNGGTLDVTGNVLDNFLYDLPIIGSQSFAGGGTIDLHNAGTLEIGGTADPAITVAFEDGSADALLLDSGAFAGRISGFRQGDRIFLNGVQADSASYASGVLTLQLAGVTVATLHIGSGYFSENFLLASVAGSTTITETATPPPPAGSITWLGGVDTDFNHAGNWDQNRQPNAADDVAIGNGDVVRVVNQPVNEVNSLQIAAGATLAVDSGEFTIDNVTTHSRNDGEFDIDSSSAGVALSNQFRNDGLISLNGPGAQILTNSSTVEIRGSGTIAMHLGTIHGRSAAGTAANPFDTLENGLGFGNLIHGSGVIGGAAVIAASDSLNFINDGTVDADDATAPLRVAGTIVNHALLESSNGGTLVLAGSVDDATSSAFNFDGAEILAQAGSTVELDNAIVQGGFVKTVDTGRIEVSGDSTLVGPAASFGGAVTVNGLVFIDPGVTLTLTGSIVGAAAIDATQGYLRLDNASVAGDLLVSGPDTHIIFGPAPAVPGPLDPDQFVSHGGVPGVDGANNPLNGGNGGDGGAGGGASAIAVGSTNLRNTAVAGGGAGGNGGQGGPGGHGGRGAAGGSAFADAATTTTDSGGTAAVADAQGNSGGAAGPGGTAAWNGNDGGAGGAATAQAFDENDGGSASATASALGGSGGLAIGPGRIPGAAGSVTGTKATAIGNTAADATVVQTGGNGGSSEYGGTAAAGAGSNLVNAATGTTMHGALQLAQTAVGGTGGTGLGAIAGRGGDATSSLIDDDTANAPAHQSAFISANVVASAGGGGFVGSDSNFGFGDGTPAAGGDATATATIIGVGPVVVSVRAFGGGGSLDNGGSAGNGGHGGLATATADIVAGVETATTGGSSAAAAANGGSGGNATGPGKTAGDGGGVFALHARGVDDVLNASGVGMSVSVTALGGIGGDGFNGASGGIGADVVLTTTPGGTQVVSGRTNNNYLTLAQFATAGNGGSSNGGTTGRGGHAESTLIVDEATASNASLSLQAFATGGSGGAGTAGSDGSRGLDGLADAEVLHGGANEITSAFAEAVGGSGGESRGGAGTGGAAAGARAIAVASGGDNASAQAFVQGGVGGGNFGDASIGSSGEDGASINPGDGRAVATSTSGGATAIVTAIAGNGGAADLAGNSAGNGGDAVGSKAVANGFTDSAATVTQVGGAGGAGGNGASGGHGGSSTLIDAVSGSTHDRQLTLTQTATGGYGGSAPGNGGAADSELTFNDLLNATAAQSVAINAIVSATGGGGGGSAIRGADGGNAVAKADITGTTSVGIQSSATGGAGGAGAGLAGMGAGGSAIAVAKAAASLFNVQATAHAGLGQPQAGSSIAEAQAIGTGSGQVFAGADSTQAAGLVLHVATNTISNGDGSAEADARTSIGESAFSAAFGDGASVADATAEPLDIDAAPVLAANATIQAALTAGGTEKPTLLAMGVLNGAHSSATDGTSETASSSIHVQIDPTRLADPTGHLLLGLFDAHGFTSPDITDIRLDVFVNGVSSAASADFASEAAALAYVTDDALDLGALSGTGPIDIGLTLAVTSTSDPGDPAASFGFGVLLGSAQPVVVTPRVLDWTGAANTSMANANNWTDLTDNLTPADSGPGQLDTLLFQTGGGLLTGAVSVNFAQFAGGAPWTLASTGTLLAGTTIEVLPGGVFTNDGGVVDPPALVIDAGGTSGGFGTFDFGTVTNNGTFFAATGHTASLTAGAITGTGTLRVDGGGDLILNTASVGTGQTVSFGGAAGILTFGPNDIGGFAGTIAGFTAGDEIVLDNASLTSVSVAGSALTLFGPGGTTLGTLNFASAADAAAAALPGAVTTQAICFLAGTRIAIPGGEVAVECLAAGDAVVTLRGEVRRIAWVGCGKVLATRGRRGAATPVIVRKGALADNVPHRDLRITKGHSLYIDSVLIPVEFLVNHRSIVWDDHAQEVSIYHIELDSHDVLIANGAPAESYRDDGNRWLFQNANSGWDLPPQPPCAPVLTGGPVVDAAWRRLLDRCGARPGVPLTADPDLHLLVDGRRIDAIEQYDDMYVFWLPAPPRVARICSRAAVPQELGLVRDDRALGVAVRRIVLAQTGRQACIEADSEAFVDGYHAFEPDNGIRWTNGDAAIPAELFAGMSGPGKLTLHISGSTQYIDEGTVLRVA